MFKATISITLRPSILDPQGKTVHHALTNLGYDAVERVRMGKLAELWIDADSEADARSIAEDACDKLLANPVTENYAITLTEADPDAVASDAAQSANQ
jgi:phosphoribosylformylglycinamidine synthase